MQSNVHKLDRRAVLTGTAATAAALAATALPVEAGESARDIIKRAGSELADAMNGYDDGQWFALVYPSKKIENGLWLGNRAALHSFDGDPELFELEKKWRKTVEAVNKASKESSEAEKRYFETRGGRFEAREEPAGLREAQRDMKLRELGDKAHPVNVAIEAFYAEERQRREAWEAEDERASVESGHDKAEARFVRALDRERRAFHAIMAKPARTLNGLRLKVRVTEEHCEHVEIDEEAWNSLAADIMRGVDSVTS